MPDMTPDTRQSIQYKATTTNEWIGQVSALHRALELCPADLTARSKLAVLLEGLEEWDGALFNWRRILAYDPNNLQAWEGMARCRKTSLEGESSTCTGDSDPESP